MKQIRLIALILIVIASVGIFSFFSRKVEERQVKLSRYEIVPSPILLISSYLNLKDNFTTDSIRAGLINGNIACTEGLGEVLKKAFGLPSLPKNKILSAIDLADENSLVFTELDSVDARFQCKKINEISFFSDPMAYPLWKSGNAKDFRYNEKITHYVHTGVTAITRSAGTVINKQGIDWYISNIERYFKNPEIIHVSNEVSMMENCDYSSMKYKFATKTAHMEILRRLNATVVELTGNHNLDVGTDAYLNSLKWYQKNNMQYFGGGANEAEASRPLVKTMKDGEKVAWIGFNELCPLAECTDKKTMGALRYEESRARSIIDSLKRKAGVSYILACVQFRELDSYTPGEIQKKICKDLIDMGADVVLGSQAHQPQEISVYKGKPIFYGLGNFLFDQIHRIGVRQAFFLNCYFYKGRIIQFQPIYTFMTQNRQPAIASDEEKILIQKQILKKQNF